MTATEALLNEGVDLDVVQGWIPPAFLPAPLLDALGYLVTDHPISSGLAKRRLAQLPRERNHSIAGPEFLEAFLNAASRTGVGSRDQAAVRSWTAFGRKSRKFLDRIDIFHARSGAGRGGAIARARRLGAKVLADHSIAHPDFLSKALAAEFDRLGPNTAPSYAQSAFWKMVLEDCEEADHVVVNSDFVKQTFIDQGFDADRLSVVYLGVRSDFIGLKQDYGTGNELQILFTGNFGIRKGAPYLLAALEQLYKDGVRFRLTVLGNAAEMKAALAASPVAAQVSTPGFVPQDELKTHLANADLYLFPSLAEGCASSVMEALAAGLPVVTTRESGAPIENEQTGLLVPARSTEAIASAVRQLAADEALRASMGRTAAAMIAGRYQWPDYARNMRAVYEEISAA